MDDYFTYNGTEASSAGATPITPQQLVKPRQPITTTTSSGAASSAAAVQTTMSPILTETASTPATQAHELFQQTAKDYKKAGVKMIIKRYGK